MENLAETTLEQDLAYMYLCEERYRFIGTDEDNEDEEDYADERIN
jgi:hypothetical protein